MSDLPTTLGRYKLIDRISVGGMAEIFRAKAIGEVGFEKEVAVKRILPHMASDREFIDMFIDEAKTVAQLSHANICQIFEFGQAQGSYFIALELVEGKDLKELMTLHRQEGKVMPLPIALYIMGKTCEALDYAHNSLDAGGQPMCIVHRDVSPQNILVSYLGTVKLIDFGIAKAMGRLTKTQAGSIKGKFSYMSPEQVMAKPVDHRSDIFACGTVLWECLTNQRLFKGDNEIITMQAVRKAEVQPPSELVPSIPQTLDPIVLRSLARDVEDRYQTIGEFLDDLEEFALSTDNTCAPSELGTWLKETFPEDYEKNRRRHETPEEEDGVLLLARPKSTSTHHPVSVPGASESGSGLQVVQAPPSGLAAAAATGEASAPSAPAIQAPPPAEHTPPRAAEAPAETSHSGLSSPGSRTGPGNLVPELPQMDQGQGPSTGTFTGMAEVSSTYTHGQYRRRSKMPLLIGVGALVLVLGALAGILILKKQKSPDEAGGPGTPPPARMEKAAGPSGPGEKAEPATPPAAPGAPAPQAAPDSGVAAGPQPAPGKDEAPGASPPSPAAGSGAEAAAQKPGEPGKGKVRGSSTEPLPDFNDIPPGSAAVKEVIRVQLPSGDEKPSGEKPAGPETPPLPSPGPSRDPAAGGEPVVIVPPPKKPEPQAPEGGGQDKKFETPPLPSPPKKDESAPPTPPAKEAPPVPAPAPKEEKKPALPPPLPPASAEEKPASGGETP